MALIIIMCDGRQGSFLTKINELETNGFRKMPFTEEQSKNTNTIKKNNSIEVSISKEKRSKKKETKRKNLIRRTLTPLPSKIGKDRRTCL